MDTFIEQAGNNLRALGVAGVANNLRFATDGEPRVFIISCVTTMIMTPEQQVSLYDMGAVNYIVRVLSWCRRRDDPLMPTAAMVALLHTFGQFTHNPSAAVKVDWVVPRVINLAAQIYFSSVVHNRPPLYYALRICMARGQSLAYSKCVGDLVDLITYIIDRHHTSDEYVQVSAPNSTPASQHLASAGLAR